MLCLAMSIGYSILFLYFMSVFAELFIKIVITAVEIFLIIGTVYFAVLFVRETNI
jgi:hypothetical protein